MHQLRVAAVGKMLADKTPGVSVEHVVLTGLFHDMANILKIDLSPEGNLAMQVTDDERAQLQALKDSFAQKYGADEHGASITIGREIGLPQEVLNMIDTMRFLKSEWVLHEGSMAMKIAKYSDLRVSPFGIVSMQERFDEAGKRYRNKTFDTGDVYDQELKERMNAACFEIERIVMDAAGMRPEEITDASAAPGIEELKRYLV